MKKYPTVLLLTAVIFVAAAIAQPRPVARDDRSARQAVDRWLGGFGGGTAGEVVTLDERYLRGAIQSLRFFVVRFRSYPVGPPVPEGLATNNLVAVHPDGRVQQIPDVGALETIFRSAAAPVSSRKGAADATRAWLRLTQEFHQDGFFQFADPDILTYKRIVRGIQVSGRVRVLPDAGDGGEIRVRLIFDRTGRLAKASEVESIVAGHRPV